ncbi:hypothetical protein [Posidoniimonas polymericola]|uniref:hypothetical protein n=1 Tax=Posidoniimonas polymericola TaxID=2528002 RepID=UPI0011B79DC1|nr:hypothetical protein [Posidoniimonas polymericola]
MATIICNITNLDRINGVRGLQSIVRTIASALSVRVVRGYQVVRWQAADSIAALAGATAKPAYATLPSVAPRMAMHERSRSMHRASWQAESLGSFASCPGRVERFADHRG